MDDFKRVNKELWNKLARLHARSEFYDNEAFKQGKCTLDEIEPSEVGNTDGKSLLHLQCHFGQDTLSWARRGAVVTGVDFSEDAIELARSLAAELRIPATFICCELSDLPQQLKGQFDIVFTSGGVINWLPDLARWARIIAGFLKPGGMFYLREFHPFSYVFDDSSSATTPIVKHPYFRTDQPLRFENQGSYATPKTDAVLVSYEWPHSMADILNSLIGTGLKIEFLHEFPFTSYQSHPFLQKSDDGRWRYPGMPGGMPLMFSIKAVKSL